MNGSSSRRILIIGLNFTPELTGIGKYTGELGEWLARHGHEVRAITAPPYYPAWRIGSGFRNRYAVQDTPGLRIYRCPIYVPARPSALRRIVHLASFALTSFPVAMMQLAWRPDAVLTIVPTYTSTPAAWLIARLTGAKCLLHIQDFEVDAMFDVVGVRSGWLRRTATAIERGILRGFDQVSTISMRMRQGLIDKGIPAGRTAIFRNWVDLNEIQPLDDPWTARREYGIGDDKVVCLYSGNMGRKQGLETIADAARQLAGRADILFLICGNGEMRAQLEAQTGDLGNVRFMDLQPKEKLNALLNCADIHLLPQKRSAADLVLPSKLCGMLASGRPVIACADAGTELGNIVAGCAVRIDPEDAQAMCGAIVQLADDPVQRKDLGLLGRTVALNLFAIDQVIGDFVETSIGGAVHHPVVV